MSEQNKLPKFRPYDIVRVKKNKSLVIISKVEHDKNNEGNEGEWSYAVENIDPKIDNHHAWYHDNDLIYVNNLFSILVEATADGEVDELTGLDLKRRRD